jgi:hypothetical protein
MAMGQASSDLSALKPSVKASPKASTDCAANSGRCAASTPVATAIRGVAIPTVVHSAMVRQTVVAGRKGCHAPWPVSSRLYEGTSDALSLERDLNSQVISPKVGA